MKDIIKDYRKYRWFYTSSGKLVVGGKNAEQNDLLMGKIIKMKESYGIMHTKMPGSPFCIILNEIEKIDKKDIKEGAVFTACFSRAWKEGMKKVIVDFFNSKQISKPARTNVGTWHVNGKILHVGAELKLVLVKQKGYWRAVPEESAGKNKIMAYLYPGKVDKKDIAIKLQFELGDNVNIDEINSAIPAGGIRIFKKK